MAITMRSTSQLRLKVAHTQDEENTATADETPLSTTPSSADGNYELGAVIDRDSFSVVYRARLSGSNRRLAMRVFTSGMQDDEAMKRFKCAAESASTWSHAGLATVHDFGFSESGKPFVVTDELSGTTLEEVLRREKHLPADRAVKRFIQVCDALAYVSWTKNTIGDLSSRNVLFTRDADGAEATKLVNIGLHVEGQFEIDGLPPSGAALSYASPERCSGQDADERSAIYSIGCLLYEALTGRCPFTGDDDLAIIQQHLSGKPAKLFKRERKRDQKLEAIVLKCLEKRPQDRYQTFNELANELEFALAAPAAKVSPIRAFFNRNKWAAACSGVAECAILCGAVFLSAATIQHGIQSYDHNLSVLRGTIASAGNAAERHDMKTSVEMWQLAIDQAKHLGQPRPVIADLHMSLGTALEESSKREEAEKEFFKALAIYDRQGLRHEANTALTSIIAPVRSQLERHSGEALGQNITSSACNRYTPVYERFVELVRVNKGIENASLEADQLAGMLIKSGKYERAEKLLKEVIAAMQTESCDQLNWRLADCLARENKLAQSAQAYKQAFDHISSFGNSYVRLGCSGLNLGNYCIPYDVVHGETPMLWSGPDDLRMVSSGYQRVLRRLGRTGEADKVQRMTEAAMRGPSGGYYYEPSQPPVTNQNPYLLQDSRDAFAG